MRSPPSIIYGASLTKELLSFHREATSRLHFSVERHTFLSIFRSRIGPGTSAGSYINASDFIFERFSISVDLFAAYLLADGVILQPFTELCIMFFQPSEPSVLGNGARVFAQDVAEIKGQTTRPLSPSTCSAGSFH